MREIEFRAWKDGEMIGNFPNTLDTWENKDLYILMQYTGLKDKNGVEIYQNDHLLVVEDVVVETIGGYPRTEPEGEIKTVEWKDGAFWWGEELLNEVAKYGEIIGNIYENPELLANNPTNDN